MRSRKVWTAQDDEDLRYWHACRYTDGRIARKMRCCRRTILRQREALGLRAVVVRTRRPVLVAEGRERTSANY